MKHHDRTRELWVGFYKKGQGPSGLTYLQAVDEALCFGWIDTTVRRVDDRCYAQRFAPRRSKSPWSMANRAKARRLIIEGRMAPAGLVAFHRRDDARDRRDSESRRVQELPDELRRRFQANRFAWAFFAAQPPS